MNIILFDTPRSINWLRPFSYTRTLAKLRVGIFTIEEKWRNYLQGDISYLVEPYLSDKFPYVKAQENLCINSTILPDQVLVEAIKQLNQNQKLVKEETLIAARCDGAILQAFQDSQFETSALRTVVFDGPCTQIKKNWDIFLLNDQELRKDFQWICQKGSSQRPPDKHTITYNEPDIFLAEGVSIKAAILNAESGPIYIGRNATIQEGAKIRGPVAICEGAQVNTDAVVRNATTIGPYTKVGGEVSNSIILGYSNKAHAGFMGNSIIGEWCNLGAGSNTSNLRNDYANIKMWDDYGENFDVVDLQFCGLFMGDHSKCAINTMFDAGTTVGVSANLLGIGFFDKVIPSFTWGKPGTHIQTYRLDKALTAAERMMERRMVQLKEEDRKILAHIFLATAIYRS